MLIGVNILDLTCSSYLVMFLYFIFVGPKGNTMLRKSNEGGEVQAEYTGIARISILYFFLAPPLGVTNYWTKGHSLPVTLLLLCVHCISLRLLKDQ